LILCCYRECFDSQGLSSLDRLRLDLCFDEFPKWLGCLISELPPIVLRKHVVRGVGDVAHEHVARLLDIRLLSEACQLHRGVRDRVLPGNLGLLSRLSCVERRPGFLLFRSFFLLRRVLLFLRIFNREDLRRLLLGRLSLLSVLEQLLVV